MRPLRGQQRGGSRGKPRPREAQSCSHTSSTHRFLGNGESAEEVPHACRCLSALGVCYGRLLGTGAGRARPAPAISVLPATTTQTVQKYHVETEKRRLAATDEKNVLSSHTTAVSRARAGEGEPFTTKRVSMTAEHPHTRLGEATQKAANEQHRRQDKKPEWPREGHEGRGGARGTAERLRAGQSPQVRRVAAPRRPPPASSCVALSSRSPQQLSRAQPAPHRQCGPPRRPAPGEAGSSRHGR